MNKTVLLIEDDLFIRDLYQRQLTLGGFQVEAAATATEGIQKAGQMHMDIILLDIMLPDMNGIDVLKKLQENETTRNFPVIMLSNMAQDDIMNQAKSLGAKKYLIKSLLTPDQILDEVNNLLQDKPVQAV
jgi:two-component system phosphate regulon response regulator PhoB